MGMRDQRSIWSAGKPGIEQCFQTSCRTAQIVDRLNLRTKSHGASLAAPHRTARSLGAHPLRLVC